MEKLLNCWNFMKCGFGLDGSRIETEGLCAAARESRLDGVHGGRYGGRSCWILMHTLDCGEEIQENLSAKYPVCINCRFYWKVREEEGRNFEVSLLLNSPLHDK